MIVKTNYYKIIFKFLIILILSCGNLFAQNTGSIYFNGDEKSDVYLNNQYKTRIPDTGSIIIKGLVPGLYKMEIKKEGYINKVENIRVMPNSQTFFEFHLISKRKEEADKLVKFLNDNLRFDGIYMGYIGKFLSPARFLIKDPAYLIMKFIHQDNGQAPIIYLDVLCGIVLSKSQLRQIIEPLEYLTTLKPPLYDGGLCWSHKSTIEDICISGNNDCLTIKGSHMIISSDKKSLIFNNITIEKPKYLTCSNNRKLVFGTVHYNGPMKLTFFPF